PAPARRGCLSPGSGASARSERSDEELPMSQIERVGVVGCGLMGSGIAEVCARAGLDVIVREVNQGALDAGRKRIEGSLDRGVRSGKLPEAERDGALSKLRYTTDFGD